MVLIRPLSVVEGNLPVVGVSTTLNQRVYPWLGFRLRSTSGFTRGWGFDYAQPAGLHSGWGFDYAQPAGLPVVGVSTTLNQRVYPVIRVSTTLNQRVYPVIRVSTTLNQRVYPWLGFRLRSTTGFISIYSGLNAIWIDVQFAQFSG